MRDFRGILEAMLVVVMVCAVPAVSMGALMFDRPTQTEYNEVVITEETEANGLDGNPEIHVLEGSF